MSIVKGENLGIFAAGVLFGTAGLKILSTKEAKNVYVKCAAAGLRGKDYIVETATVLQENAEDIIAEAKKMNEEKEKAQEQQEDEIQDKA